jgi:DNA-binding NarL/FixJ family response regulator
MTATLSPTHPRHTTSSLRGHAPIRILIVDDHPAVRLGARALFDDQPDMRVVAEARGAAEALDTLDTPIDVALVDYHLRHGADGLTVISALQLVQPAARALVYSAFADSALAVAALVAGADGLLGKHELGDQLCDTIRRLARGRRYLPRIQPAVAHTMGARLDPGDRVIFAMLLSGVDPRTIAERLSLTEHELASRRAAMLRSLRPEGAQLGLSAQRAVPLDYDWPERARAGAEELR